MVLIIHGFMSPGLSSLGCGRTGLSPTLPSGGFLEGSVALSVSWCRDRALGAAILRMTLSQRAFGIRQRGAG